jgi:hypothetical protein
MRWWMRRIAGAQPFKLDRDTGAIRPDRVTGWIFSIFYGLLCIGGIALLVALPESAIASVPLAIIGFVFAGCMLPSVTDVHALYWSNEGVEGPTHMIIGTLGARRTSIAWSDFVKSGTSITMYWYLEARDGRRVYWSFLYVGHTAFTAAIQHHRPDLAIPEAPIASFRS